MALSGWLPQKNFGKILCPLGALLVQLQHDPLSTLSGSVGRINNLVNSTQDMITETRTSGRILNSNPAQYALSQFMTQYRA